MHNIIHLLQTSEVTASVEVSQDGSLMLQFSIYLVHKINVFKLFIIGSSFFLHVHHKEIVIFKLYLSECHH